MMFEHSEQVSEKSFQSPEVQINPAFQLSEDLVEALLDKLTSDHEFRAVFQRSPRIALAYLGHEAAAKANDDDQGIWECITCTSLASPDIIKASRDLIRAQLLTEQASLKPVNLQP